MDISSLKMTNIGLNMNLDLIIYVKTRRWKIKKALQKARTLFNSLKFDPNSVLFSEEKIDNRLLKKLNE